MVRINLTNHTNHYAAQFKINLHKIIGPNHG